MSLKQDIDWYKDGERDLDFLCHLLSGLLAERDALRDRLCDGCASKGRDCEPYRTWGCVHPDFACNRWAEREKA